jgi:hypothetical protein
MFRSGEERQAGRREREAGRARAKAEAAEQARQAEEARRYAEYLRTPVGAAAAAKEAGQVFFEIQLEVGGHTGSASWGMASGQRMAASSAAVLGEIERAGWRLEHASYFYMVTSETSTSRAFASGEATVVQGTTVGVYLFRNTDYR